MDMTLAQAAAFCGGTVLDEYREVRFSGLRTDSRQITPGQLFAALRAERDGFAFIPAAMANGAAAVLADRQPEGIPAVVVRDVRKAMGDIARARRAMLTAKFVGITGSVGKTTTKEMTAAVLSAAFRTSKTAKNYNNDLGLPMTVLDIPEDCEAAVTEMGMNHFGELSYLTSIAQPDVAVITNIGTMHIEYLGSREGILKAKLEILEGLRPGGTVIFNGDEPLLRGAEIPYRPVFFGLQPENDLRAADIVCENGTTVFRVSGLGADFTVELPAEGMHLVYDALAAVAVGLVCGVTPDRIAAALSGFENTGERQKITVHHGITVISDCYNAGPESVAAALRVLKTHGCAGNRYAVLGDMLELGDYAPQAHFREGEQASAAADGVFAFGPNSGRVVAGAVSHGMAPENARSFDSREEMAEALARTAKPGDMLLFKGSHGMHIELVLQQFLQLISR